MRRKGSRLDSVYRVITVCTASTLKCPLTSTLHPRWRSRLQIPCAGKTAEIAVDQIRTISKQRLRRRLDRLSSEHAAHLRRIITEMYGE